MTVVANALLALRVGISHRLWPITALGIALLLAAVALMTFAAVRRLQLRRAHPPSPAPPAMIGTTAVLTLTACATAIAAVALDG